MPFKFQVTKKDRSTKARLGFIETTHGKIETPAFSPVATRGSVRGLDPEDLVKTQSQVILGNTYHLYLRPGEKIIKSFGGFAPFMGWHGPTITDSGGYQVSFLWHPKSTDEEIPKTVKITDEGATFTSHLDGSKHLLTPEKSMQIQEALGADIIMAFDQPLGSNYSKEKKIDAFERTLRWEERSFIAWKKLKSNQALFGIIQGDLDKELRRKSLQFILEMGFPGLAIGGESVGSDPALTAKSLELVGDMLPDNLPLHALGLGGGPEGILVAVEKGIDTFDNTSITRLARTGLLFIYPKDGGSRDNKFRVDLNKGKFKDDKKPISKACRCYACQNFSKSYIHHLLVSKELLGMRLASIHNIFFVNDLMKQIRDSISSGDFQALKKHWLA